jgi:MGT family glycosyltransferase
MSNRYLFVTWDGGGNLHAELALARRLVERGHEVRFLGHRSQEMLIREAGCGFRAYERVPDADSSRPEATMFRWWDAGSPPELFAMLRERLLFGPAAAFAADVLAELERKPADAIAIDFMLYGAHAAAERSGLPSAVLYHTVYAPPTVEVPPFGPGLPLPRSEEDRRAHRDARAQRLEGWNLGLPALNAARADIGLLALGSVFEQFERLDRVLVLTSAAFDFAAVTGASLPDNVRYVGPQVEVGASAREGAEADGDDPLVLVSFSTVYQAQEQVVRRVVAALGALPVRGLVTTGPALELDGWLPENVEARAWAPHAEVLPFTALVVTHAGHGTTMASLAHGVPLVCVPMGTDQHEVSTRVVQVGAGVRLDQSADQEAIAAAIQAALGDPDLRVAARRLADEIGAELAADRAVAELEALAGRAPLEQTAEVSGLR